MSHFFIYVCRSPVSVFKFGVSVKNKEADDISSPSDEELTSALTPLNLKTTSVARKLRKLYLVGAKSSLDYKTVASSLSVSWAQSNTGIVFCPKTSTFESQSGSPFLF